MHAALCPSAGGVQQSQAPQKGSQGRGADAQGGVGADLHATVAADAAVIVVAHAGAVFGNRTGRAYPAALAAGPAALRVHHRLLNDHAPREPLEKFRPEEHGALVRQAKTLDAGDIARDHRVLRDEAEGAGGAVGGQALRVDPQHAADGGIDRRGIAAGRQDPQVPRPPALARALALHGENAVDQGDRRPDGVMDLHQQPREPVSVDPVALVPLGFADAHHAAEKVLDPEGEQHHAVGLELGQVDHRVGPDRLLRQLDAPVRRPDVHRDRSPEFLQGHPQALERLEVAALAEHPLEGSRGRAVGDRRHRPPGDYPLGRGAHHQGVGLHRLVRPCRGQEVGLDEDPRPGRHRPAGGGRQQPGDLFLQRRFPVVSAGDKYPFHLAGGRAMVMS